MTHRYADPDKQVADYKIYTLDAAVLDRQTLEPLQLRGPKPATFHKGGYFACIGAAQTFGRFCTQPYPLLLQECIGLPALNLGRGGAGPSFFACENERLLEYVNGARFVILQVMSARSEGNARFAGRGIGYLRDSSTGLWIESDDAFRQLLQTEDKDVVKALVAETRKSWVESHNTLLAGIEAPTILFWFSVRRPRYRERYGPDLERLYGEFPHLVNEEMVREIRHRTNGYVECVSRKGLPQLLIDRFTGDPTTVRDEWGGVWETNAYYPSPRMHQEAARLLFAACGKLGLF